MKMVNEQHLLIVFNSVHRVMLAEIRLQNRVEILLIPVPRALSADCGMVLRCQRCDYEQVLDLLDKEQLRPFQVYRPHGDGFELVGEFC